jgi:phosphate transport system substrate-binding protein
MKHMKKYFYSLAFAALITASSSVAAADDLVVVVNKANPVGDLTSAQLKKIILGQQTSWTGGHKVSVLLRGPGQPERAGILRSVCGMAENDYNQFTMHADLNGETLTEPKVVASAVAVRQSVAGNPGAIGFVRVSDVDDSVKAVSVDGVSAGKPGYKVKTN